MNVLTSVISKGVEYETAFCTYAKNCATDLRLRDVDFINIDARYTNYSSGTVFFMYTPFEGEMLLEVLKNLRTEAKNKKIKLFTYGPCTSLFTQQDWLISRGEIIIGPGAFGEFHSK